MEHENGGALVRAVIGFAVAVQLAGFAITFSAWLKLIELGERIARVETTIEELHRSKNGETIRNRSQKDR